MFRHNATNHFEILCDKKYTTECAHNEMKLELILYIQVVNEYKKA